MKPIPASASARSTTSGPTITLMPISVSASAAPDFELTGCGCRAWPPARPAPATTKAVAVEMFSVPLPSPPVPTMSIAPFGRAHLAALRAHHRGGGGVFVHRLAPGAQRHQEAADLRRRRLAVEQDARRRARASARVSGPRRPRRRSGASGVAHAGTRRWSRKFSQQPVAVFRGDALGVELHALDRQLAVAAGP